MPKSVSNPVRVASVVNKGHCARCITISHNECAKIRPFPTTLANALPPSIRSRYALHEASVIKKTSEQTEF
jgi:hypothetical protein